MPPAPTEGWQAMKTRYVSTLTAALLAVALGGCATLQQALQAPRMTVIQDRPAELRLLGPSAERPMGGAAIRLWARVENPNAVGFTLTRFAGNLFLEGTRTVNFDFPLGVPLRAAGDTIVPMDVNLSFADAPALAQLLTRAVGENNVSYRMDGTMSVDAGLLGQPSFGPTTWLSGDMRVFR
jgi:hypothetical protein